MFRRRVATPELTPNIAFIVINAVLLQERFVRFLKRENLVVFALGLHVISACDAAEVFPDALFDGLAYPGLAVLVLNTTW
jgi:hypothetical protein